MTKYELARRTKARLGASSEYVNTKRQRSNYTCTITPQGNCFYLVDGSEVSEKQFNDMFPIGLINKSDKIRLDSRQNLF